MRALLLPVHGEWYGLPLEDVREVVPDPELTRLPLAPPGLLGVFNLRGQVVPLVDTGALLGVQPLARRPYVAVAILERALVGLAVDGPPETARLDEQVGNGKLPGTGALHASGDRVVAMLDVAALVAPERLAA
ncbi:MAG: purine-binding chemotaxis protein CheW [Thermoleophilaceae bacterium]|jgi:purine-binding chemotaxis protein CheW|nr:purine-binding chemotaxis protein CheW [Thermoleophilaceae bacterium]